MQCLAFDGKSIIFGGGFDFRIIAWDLDNVLDAPLYQLYGHQSAILKIVPLYYCDRAFSLDESGELRYWDINRFNPIDKEQRQIHRTILLEDHIRSFEVFRQVGNKFNTVSDLIISACGKKQHTYKIEDVSIRPSPPFKIMFSYELMLIITVHLKDVLFFHAVSGDRLHKKSDICGPSGELTSACLDDRNRKLILGDSTGIINVYNCLNGAHLKTIPVSNSAISHLLYSPDKTIICLAGQADLIILDEFPRESDIDVTLREARAHDADVTCISYSFLYGLIATADCIGRLMIWDYEFLTLEQVINNATTGELCQVRALHQLNFELTPPPSRPFPFPVGLTSFFTFLQH